MNIAIVTGSLGLVGSAVSRLFSSHGFLVVGIDNDMRRFFFGADASTGWVRAKLEESLPNYRHHAVDIRDNTALRAVFSEYGLDTKVVIHCAAQPSHDWATTAPLIDFTVNANGTLHLLEATRHYCPQAVFMHCSTNKVYGDVVNSLPMVELETRIELSSEHAYAKHGVDESMSIDQSMRSLFGVSKTAADLMVQEYGRYYGMKCAVFRGGCLSGPGHAGAALHGFLAYLMKCTITGKPYQVLGYNGKQVRDNIHSHDLACCFYQFFLNPRVAAVYNIGGSRHSNCSVLEAIALCERISGKKLRYTLSNQNRVGDHIWWISDVRKFQEHYPGWQYTYSLENLLVEIHDELVERNKKRKGIAAPLAEQLQN